MVEGNVKKVQGFYTDIVNASHAMSDEELIKHLDKCLTIVNDLTGDRIELVGKWSGQVIRWKNWILWKDYEPFFIKRYIREMVEELYVRDKVMGDRYCELYYQLWKDKDVEKARVKTPIWLANDFVESHSKHIVEELK